MELKHFIDVLFKLTNFYHFNHPSSGGGGAHKCCSNSLTVNKEISFDKWLYFCKLLNINVNKYFIKGIKSEINKLKKIISK